jgi:hypothetical protein
VSDSVVTLGAGEYVFGTSLGHLRSEEDVPSTFHVFPPQLTDTCMDGTTIVGDGFHTQIDTRCTCANSMSAAHLIDAGVDASVVGRMINMSDATSTRNALVQYLYPDGADKVNLTTILTGVHIYMILILISGTNICGGIDKLNPATPVCQTVFSNHTKAFVMAQ